VTLQIVDTVSEIRPLIAKTFH